MLSWTRQISASTRSSFFEYKVSPLRNSSLSFHNAVLTCRSQVIYNFFVPAFASHFRRSLPTNSGSLSDLTSCRTPFITIASADAPITLALDRRRFAHTIRHSRVYSSIKLRIHPPAVWSPCTHEVTVPQALLVPPGATARA